MFIDQPQYFKLKNILHSILLLAAMMLLLSLLGWLIAGYAGMLWALFTGLLLLFLIPKLSSKLTLYLYHARPMPNNDLHDIIDQLSRRSQLEKVPSLYYLPSSALLSFSTGFYPEQVIAISDAMIRYLNRRELIAVLAHEISHLKNQDLWVMVVADIISRLTSIMALFGYLMLVIYLPVKIINGEDIPWLLFIILILAPNISALLQLALSRTREFTADAQAIELTGDPEGLISALNKMNQFEKHWLQKMLLPGYRHPQPSLLRTHPLTEERIRRLRLMASEANKHDPDQQRFIKPGTNKVTKKPRHRFPGIWH